MTWRENIERVREALKIATMNNTYVHLTHPEAQGVLDALAALTAQIEELEKIRNVVGTEGGTARQGTAGRSDEVGSVGSGASFQSEVGADNKAKEWRDIADDYLSQRDALTAQMEELEAQLRRERHRAVNAETLLIRERRGERTQA